MKFEIKCSNFFKSRLIFTTFYHYTIKSGENIIITNNIAKDHLKEYANKNTKLLRDVKAAKLFKIVNGLYETNPNIPAYLLVGSIYGPSYISFDYALSFYGLIPERVR